MTVFTATRRTRAFFTAAVTGVLVLTGCSTDDAADTAHTDSVLPAAEGVTQYPLTLTTPWGDTVLEERPERIAAIAPDGSTSELLAVLGVEPVIAPSTTERATVWVPDVAPGEPETYELDYDNPYPAEAIAAADPDLIVMVGGWEPEDSYERLSAIAPVLAGETEDDFAAGWEDRLRIIAEALDLSNAAEEFIAEQEGFYADFRAQHPEFAGKTATFALYYGGGYGLAYSSWAGSDVEQLFLDLGFAANPIAAEFVEDDAVSNELIGKLDADVLILVDNSEGHIDEITSQPLFQNIPAVRDGRWALVENLSQQRSAYVHDGVEHEGNLPWALSGSNPLAARWASEQLVPIVAATVQ
ncbi:ABC transporter substrate-binding protein [Rhodococcus yananensis]|uniref:ABC transporter substrate-binding protein n=1 Tax=Rhodococcus yananensis TaxID=2879464 RepID=UPI003EBD9306